MKSAALYFSFFLAVISLIILILMKLFQKYTYLSLAHLGQSCVQSLNVFFTTPRDLLGLFILGVVAALTMYLSLKVIFSSIKTQRRKHLFTSEQVVTSKRVEMV